MQQLLDELLSNALKFTAQGEIKLSASSSPDGLAFAVSDTGIGMTADELSKLFTKFNRAAGDGVRSEVGTGLGLWITKQLVEAMNGKISVESIHGVGSHFIVSFPLAKVA